MKNLRANELFGFGTHKMKDEVCYNAVKTALEVGYNLIDTAEKYHNDIEIGKAIKDSGVKRQDVYIVHKLTDVLEFSRTEEETRSKVDSYLNNLQTDYIDLLLMHGPSPRYHEQPELFKEGNIRVWKTFIDLKNEGKLKNIGVSNFNMEQIMYLIMETGVKPDFVENEFNVLNAHEVWPFVRACHSLGIQVIGYSPLATGRLAEIADSSDFLKYKYLTNMEMMPAEFALRFVLHHDVIPIPGSTSPERIKQNYESLKRGSLWRR